MPDNRPHDVSGMTDSELERARRHLLVSLTLAVPGSRAGTHPGAHQRHRRRARRAGKPTPGHVTRTPLSEVRWNWGWHFPQDMGGKVVWAQTLLEVALRAREAASGLDLEEIAEANLRRTRDRYPRERTEAECGTYRSSTRGTRLRSGSRAAWWSPSPSGSCHPGGQLPC